MAGLMDALGVALCYVLAACAIAGCIAFVVQAKRLMRKESKK